VHVVLRYDGQPGLEEVVPQPGLRWGLGPTVGSVERPVGSPDATERTVVAQLAADVLARRAVTEHGVADDEALFIGEQSQQVADGTQGPEDAQVTEALLVLGRHRALTHSNPSAPWHDGQPGYDGLHHRWSGREHVDPEKPQQEPVRDPGLCREEELRRRCPDAGLGGVGVLHISPTDDPRPLAPPYGFVERRA
jgi:hypothetical protein